MRFSADHGGYGVLANPHRSIPKFMKIITITMEPAIPNKDKTTDFDTEIFVLVVGNQIHYGVQVEFWTNLTICRCDDPSQSDNFAIFRFFRKFFTFLAVFQD